MNRFLCILLVAVPLLAAAQDTASPRKALAKYLDRDGDFYLHWNSEQFGQELKLLFTLLTGSIESVASPRERQELGGFLELAVPILSETGLSEIRGVGMSSVELADGLHRHKSVVYHGAAPTTGKIWEMFGGKPHPIDGLSMMPANTVFAFSGDLRLSAIWDWFGPEGNQLLIPWSEEVKDEAGIDLGDMLASAGDEMTLIVTMNPENPKPIDTVMVPEIAILFAIQTKNDSVYNWLETMIQEDAEKSRPITFEGASGLTVHEGWQGPVHLSWTWAKSDGYLYLATHPKVLRAALTARKTGEGLAKTAEFATLSKDLPSKANSMTFVSSQFTQALIGLARSAADDKVAAAQAAAGAKSQVQIQGVPIDGRLFAKRAKAKQQQAERVRQELLKAIAAYKPFQLYSVNVHHDDAFVSYTHATASLPMLQAMINMPSLLGMVLPAIVQNGQKKAKAAQNRHRK